MATYMEFIDFIELSKLGESRANVEVPIGFLEELATVTSQDEVLNVISRWINKVFDVERSSIALVDDEGDSFRVFALTGNDAIAIGKKMPMEMTCVGQSIMKRSALLTKGITKDFPLKDAQMLHEAGMISCLNIPFIVGDTVYGTVNIATNKEIEKSEIVEIYSFSLIIANFFNNVESRRKIERQAFIEKELISKSVQASKMAALGQMAGGMAHEINNPLAIISGFSRKIEMSLRKGKIDPEDIQKSCERIKATVDRISKITKGLLRYSRDDKNLKLEDVLVIDIINDTLPLCQTKLIDTGVELIVNVDEEIMISCHRVQVSQVLLNLINNGIDELRNCDKRRMSITLFEDSEATYISIRDSGRGIAKEHIEHIMEPFFTTKEVGDGTGLGLSISQAIMETHNGSLVYNSEVEETEFILTFNR